MLKLKGQIDKTDLTQGPLASFFLSFSLYLKVFRSRWRLLSCHGDEKGRCLLLCNQS